MHLERKKIYTSKDFDICAFMPIDLLTLHVRDELLEYKDRFIIDGKKVSIEEYVSYVITLAFSLIIDDIIDNNVTVHFKGEVKEEILISMRLMHASRYCTKKPKVIDVTNGMDIGARMFPLHMIMMRCPSWRKDGVFPVMVDDERRKRIDKHTKEGMSYGEGKEDRTIADYALLISEHTGDMPCRVLRLILRSAFFNMWRLKNLLADVYIPFDDGWCYMGILRDFNHITGRQLRYRVLYKLAMYRRTKDYSQSNYCYAALTEDLYDKVKNGSDEPILVLFFDTLTLAMTYAMDGQYYFCVNKFPISYDKGKRKYIPASEIRDVLKYNMISNISFVEYVGRHWKKMMDNELKKAS